MAFPSRNTAAYSPVSLPLHKLSFCTTATLNAKMLWEHLTGGLDMYAVFDYVKKPGLGQSVSEKQILKLVHHGDLLVRSLLHALTSYYSFKFCSTAKKLNSAAYQLLTTGGN